MSDEEKGWNFITGLLSLFNSALKDYLSKRILKILMDYFSDYPSS